ncbi:MAG: helix-hairpin-helix domain-containing protein [Halobacteriaceae archaeon]
MTIGDRDRSDSDEPLVLEKPIDIESVNKSRFLFYVADKTPLSVDELADDCSTNFVQSTLKRRFGTELNIDMVDHIRLTGEARRPVIEASKPLLETAQQLLSRGEDFLDEEEHSHAADRLSKSVAVLEAVREKLRAVDHESSQVDRLLTTAKKQHDVAAKEATKDSINYHILQTKQHESRGDEQRDDDPPAAVSAYQKAREALLDAIEVTKEYNDSRVHHASAELSTEPLTDRLNSISDKINTIDEQIEDPNSSSPTSQTGSDDAIENQPLREVQSDIPDFGRSKRIQLAREGYESLSDIASSSKKELTNVDRVGPQTAEKLLSYVETNQSQLATTDNGIRATDSDRTDGADTSRAGPRGRAQSEPTDSTESGGKNGSGEPRLDSSAFENSWETISKKNRIDGQFLAKVVDIKTPKGDRKSETLVVADRTGKEIELDVWKTHDIDIDWSVGEWYALMEVTGNVWQTDRGRTKKRLSTTSDFEILSLGADFDPATPERASPSETASEDRDTSTETRGASDTPSSDHGTGGTDTRSETETKERESTGESDNDGIFEDIMSDFDDLE